jgi:hypothetical protein
LLAFREDIGFFGKSLVVLTDGLMLFASLMLALQKIRPNKQTLIVKTQIV